MTPGRANQHTPGPSRTQRLHRTAHSIEDMQKRNGSQTPPLCTWRLQVQLPQAMH